jgi:hypothetical protein
MAMEEEGLGIYILFICRFLSVTGEEENKKISLRENFLLHVLNTE